MVRMVVMVVVVVMMMVGGLDRHMLLMVVDLRGRVCVDGWLLQVVCMAMGVWIARSSSIGQHGYFFFLVIFLVYVYL